MADENKANAGETEEMTEGTDEQSGIEKLNWTKLAVRDAHGAIDSEGTLALVTEALAQAVGNEVDLEEIRGAVSTVFTKLLALPGGGSALKGKMDLDGVAGRARELLDVPFGAETMVQLRIKNFIRGESEKFVETNGAEGSCHIKRGKDGGVRVRTDAYVKEYRALQAKKAAADAK